MKAIQEFLQEGYILSDKTISVNLEKFENGSEKKLLIIGSAGSGKTSVGKILSKKYKVPIYNTDDINSNVRNDLNMYDIDEVSKSLDDKADELIFQNIKKLIQSPEKSIVEGVGLMDPGLRKYILHLPMIIMGRSSLYSALKGSGRVRGGNRSRIHEFWLLTKHNIKKIEKELQSIHQVISNDKTKIIKKLEM